MLNDKLSLVPKKPGCYLMKNADGTIIYVGKAKNLKNRLSSYFHGTHTGKTLKLVSEIVTFEYVVVSSETEALILELNLIKKYDPKYNILLRDDKSYPYIELTDDKVPRLLVVRNINRKRKHKNKLYGPYPNVTAARGVVNLLNRVFPIRKCEKYQKSPCLYYHIGECLGYCQKVVPNDKINQLKSDITKFLNGDEGDVVLNLKNRMKLESDQLNFEQAYEIKKLLDYIDITLRKQKVEIDDLVNRDVFGYDSRDGYLSMQVFFIRGGKMVERHSKIIPMIEDMTDEVTRYIVSFYSQDILLPKEILLPDIKTLPLIKECLNTSIKVPARGVKKRLVDMAINNAKIALNENFDLIKKEEERTIGATDELKNLLGLKQLNRIEIFDNSNLFGRFTVSGMAVFVNGLPSKNDYRKYKITNDRNDDYHTMHEVIYRRYFKVISENLIKPDLIIVDGGLNQIRASLEALASLNLTIKVVGLKKDQHHQTNELIDISNTFHLDKHSNLFHLLTRMQDEVHNYTVNYHRQIRSKGALSSILDTVFGIGSRRKTLLLQKYGSVDQIKEAPIEELSQIIPADVAEDLKKILDRQD